MLSLLQKRQALHSHNKAAANLIKNTWRSYRSRIRRDNNVKIGCGEFPKCGGVSWPDSIPRSIRPAKKYVVDLNALLEFRRTKIEYDLLSETNQFKLDDLAIKTEYILRKMDDLERAIAQK